MLFLVIALAVGCVFDERTVPMRPEYFKPVHLTGDATVPQADVATVATPAARRPANTREWLALAQSQLAALLPPRGRHVMLAEQMTGTDGKPRDVYAWFGRAPSSVNKATQNWNGLVHTAQACSRDEAIDKPAPPWPGFQTLWIPVADGVELHGRLALARDTAGRPVSADCIVLLPGFLGDNAVMRTRDLAAALHDNGFHVLAIELRGHGRTEHYFPDVYYTFGVLETQDLMRVSEWLQDHHACIRDTGLVGFCWGANQAMLAAWFDGRQPDDPSILPAVARHLDPPSKRRHYAAGVIAFSPVLRWEDLMDQADLPHEMKKHPSMYFFQEGIKARMRRKGYPEVTSSLRHLIHYEYAHSELGPAFPLCDAYQSLRFMSYRGLPDGAKLEHVRVPVLLVTSVNDPLLSAQDMADLTARTRNPLVAPLILRGGGHVGFAPYNPPYFYSLILNFFDPHTGPAALAGTRQ